MKNTLLKDYKGSWKSSVFVDKRIGEQKEELGDFDKKILRSHRQMQVWQMEWDMSGMTLATIGTDGKTVKIKVKMDCDGCERKVRRSVEGMKGMTSVTVEKKQHKLIVVGYVDPNKVLRRVAYRTGKKVKFWPYVPYDIVAHPYAQGFYDNKAPAGYVRYVDDPYNNLAQASSAEVRYTTAFSDENPLACAICKQCFEA